MSSFHLYISYHLTLWVACVPLESPLAYNMYLFSLRIAKYISINIFLNIVSFVWSGQTGLVGVLNEMLCLSSFTVLHNMYVLLFLRSIKHNGRTHNFKLLQNIFLNILMGIYQMPLLHIRFLNRIYRALNERKLYLDVVLYGHVHD